MEYLKCIDLPSKRRTIWTSEQDWIIHLQPLTSERNDARNQHQTTSLDQESVLDCKE